MWGKTGNLFYLTTIIIIRRRRIVIIVYIYINIVCTWIWKIEISVSTNFFYLWLWPKKNWRWCEIHRSVYRYYLSTVYQIYLCWLFKTWSMLVLRQEPLGRWLLRISHISLGYIGLLVYSISHIYIFFFLYTVYIYVYIHIQSYIYI